MTKYRKITDTEFKNILSLYRNNKQITQKLREDIVKIIKQKYVGGENASTVTLVIDSEYNDQYYENSASTVIVFDADGNELVPKKGLHLSARQEVTTKLSSAIDLGGTHGEGTEEYLGSMTFELSNYTPDLYVKESE